MQTRVRPIAPRVLVVAAVLTLAGVFGAGCAFKGGGAGGGPVVEGAWEPRVVGLRVLPSSRYVVESGQPLLEARVELIDAMGDAMKASGTLVAELYPSAGGGSSATGPRLYRWETPVLTLADQQRFYDAIIRGYLLRLRIDEPAVTQRPTQLRVAFEAADGQRFTGDLPLEAATARP